MKQLLVPILGLHVLWHALFGCCGHALLVPSAIGATPHDVQTTNCTHGECGGHLSGEHRARSLAHTLQGSVQDANDTERLPGSEGHFCCRDKCKWICESNDSERDNLGPWQLVAPSDENIPDRTTTASAELLRHQLPDNTAAPPLRRHLALAVMLI